MLIDTCKLRAFALLLYMRGQSEQLQSTQVTLIFNKTERLNPSVANNNNPYMSAINSTKTLILGGVRSGKSRLAEQIATDSKLNVCYIATAQVGDAEMRKRIVAHRARRPEDWVLVEEPYQLGSVLAEHAAPDRCLLVDCMTLWLTNLLTADNVKLFKLERDNLLSALPTLSGKIILVTNETNMGVVPMGKLSRRFCDESGILHQELAQHCEQVILTVAGLPHVLKGNAL